MLDFICMGPVDLPGARRRRQNTKWKRGIYGLYIKSAPFFGDLKKFPETKNNSRFYILKLHFLLHYNRVSCPVTSLLDIAIQSWCVLFNVARGFAAQKSLRENIPWFFVYSQFNIFSV